MSNELEDNGWIKTTTIDEPRLTEIVNEYKRLGFEVRIEPPNYDYVSKECRSCNENNEKKIRTVYIRKCTNI